MILKYVKCKHCGSAFNVELDDKVEKFVGEYENSFLQNECLKIQRRIDKLQYRHDYEDLPSWKFEDVNNQMDALKKILNILERYI